MFILIAIIAFFSKAFYLLSTAFMIWMLIDCVKNRAIQKKGMWIIFILFTQFIGSTVYFFARGPWPKVKAFLFARRSFSGYPIASVPPLTPEGTFSAYEQGYQAKPRAPMSTPYEKNMPTEEISSFQPEYEQSLVAYPEMPPMEQFQ